MFSRLTNFGLKRTPKQAIGFYFTFLLFIIVVSSLSGAAVGFVSKDVTYEFGARIGTFIAIVTCMYVTFAILQKKKQLKNVKFLLLLLLSAVLAYAGGGLLGLIPASYLSTK